MTEVKSHLALASSNRSTERSHPTTFILLRAKRAMLNDLRMLHFVVGAFGVDETVRRRKLSRRPYHCSLRKYLQTLLLGLIRSPHTSRQEGGVEPTSRDAQILERNIAAH